jgi:hypothetical protein
VEKLVYSLWPSPGQDGDSLRDQLLAELPAALGQLPSVHGARLAVADSAVAPASGRRIQSHPPLPAALLSLWVDYAGEGSWLPLVTRLVARNCGYLVAEAEPLPSGRSHPAGVGERVYGMCHVVWLRKPAQLDRREWLAIWKGSHTRVAIDTQSTFGYRQNVVVQALGDDCPPCDAIVEEHFPPEAMTSDHAFYATGGDEALLQQRMTAMIESCTRFIDFDHIDVVPMSEYLLKPFAAP